MIQTMGPRMMLVGLGVLSVVVVAGAAADELKVGDPAPPFSLQGSDGKTYSLEQFKGKSAVVIAWFPKAFTGGCTKECKSLRENSKALHDLKVAYFTASVDTPEENKKFAESLDLDYPILSDPDKSVAKDYGVLNPGRGFANRWTFYIDKDGIIKAIDKKVDAPQGRPGRRRQAQRAWGSPRIETRPAPRCPGPAETELLTSHSGAGLAARPSATSARPGFARTAGCASGRAHAGSRATQT